MTSTGDGIFRTPSGSIDFDLYRDQAARERSAFIRDHAPRVPGLSPKARRRLNTLVLAFGVASAAFWATILTDPPRTVAGTAPATLAEMMRTAPLDLPSLVADPF